MLSDVIVIRNTGDIPAHLDRNLIEAYSNTRYFTLLPQLDDNGAFIEIGKNPPALVQQLDMYGFNTYAFITAWNPGSVQQDTRLNQAANLALELDMHPHCRLLRRGEGIGSDPNWAPEESFLALDILPEKAVELARKYGQNAIVVWGKGGEPEIWWVRR